MKTLEFKTNIKCAGCEEKVTPALDELAGKGNWKVDLAHPDRILAVTAEGIDADKVAQALQQNGFTAASL